MESESMTPKYLYYFLGLLVKLDNLKGKGLIYLSIKLKINCE